ncbi:AMP-binding protein [Paenibacillus athensensis]|uniref:Acyl-CoA synthetase n=1 Tax=Paenibacillus athensensis TaxID=1967502 RepID=A0A4Y8Q431_9BACL|nr:AMP-binding protein [Paenibacillus athensensis]MCD1258409.1 AMP-binding protein [Paenibacillus athensensis]
MITVNKERLDKLTFEGRRRWLEQQEPYASARGERYALCLREPLDVVTLLGFLRGRDCSALLLHGDNPLETARKLALDAGCSRLVYGGFEHNEPLAGEEMPVEPVREEEACIYQFSSGTTGAAKLVRRSWRDIDAEIAAYNEALGDDGSCSPIVLASVTHSFGLICGVLAALARGVEPTVVTHKNPKFALGIIRDTPEHLVYGVPLMLHVVSGFSSELVRFHRLLSSGAVMPGSLFERLSAKSGKVMQQYGCSETGCISLSRCLGSQVDLGRPLSHLTVRAGEAAERPEEIVVTLPDGREVRTGDLGFAAVNSGHLQFISRLDDVINAAGLKVYPLEVEEELLALAGVREAVVYRGRHPVMGEIVKAQIVAEGALEAAKVREWCAARLPAYKVPADIRFVPTIRKTANGKISRLLLETEEGV